MVHSAVSFRRGMEYVTHLHIFYISFTCNVLCSGFIVLLIEVFWVVLLLLKVLHFILVAKCFYCFIPSHVASFCSALHPCWNWCLNVN